MYMYRIFGSIMFMIAVMSYLGFDMRKIFMDTVSSFGVDNGVVIRLEENIKKENYEEAGRILRKEVDKIVKPEIRTKTYQMYLEMLEGIAEVGKINKDKLENFIMNLDIEKKEIPPQTKKK